MSVIQVTLDYLEELRELDPDASIIVTVESDKLKLSGIYPEMIVFPEDGIAASKDNNSLFLTVHSP
jgi:hypothetical protein